MYTSVQILTEERGRDGFRDLYPYSHGDDTGALSFPTAHFSYHHLSNYRENQSFVLLLLYGLLQIKQRNDRYFYDKDKTYNGINIHIWYTFLQVHLGVDSFRYSHLL